MPKKCYIKPNRTRPRYFSENDVGRIARYAVGDGADRERVLAKVMSNLGYSFVPCKAVEALAAVNVIVSALKQIVSALALGKVIEILLRFATYGKWVPIPFVRRASYAVAVAIVVLKDVVSNIDKLGEADTLVVEAFTVLKNVCEYNKSIEK
jgi:hypothetical protein